MKKLSSSCPTTIFLAYFIIKLQISQRQAMETPPLQLALPSKSMVLQCPSMSNPASLLFRNQILFVGKKILFVGKQLKSYPQLVTGSSFSSFRFFHPVKIQTSINQPEDHQYCNLYFWVPLEEMARVLVQPTKSCKSFVKLITIIILSNSEIKLVSN